MRVRRVNSVGLEVFLQKTRDGGTEIVIGKESITVEASLDQMTQAWYDWQIRGQFVQDAFTFLRPEIREFIMTGISPEEWKRIFKEEE